MTDRELLELAAKAVGKDLSRYEWHALGFFLPAGDATHFWNPLTEDGDALRLAVKLGLEVECNPPSSQTTVRKARGDAYVWVNHNGDPYAATRRAIVRAAAEIGKAMQ